MSRERNLEIAKGLREAADWIEANADLPMTNHSYDNIDFDVGTKPQLQEVARAMGTFDKQSKECPLKDWYFCLRKKFTGNIGVIAMVSRELVCKKVKVVKEVEEYECPDSILEAEFASV